MNPAEFSNIAAAEDRFWWYRGMRQIMWRLLDPIAPGRRVLEAGAGTGHFAREVARRYGVPVTAVDLGAEGCRMARRLSVDRIAQADIAALPFPDAAFDLLLSMDVLVHFPRGEEARALAEFHRVLSPGGTAVIRVSALDWLRSRHSTHAHERQRFTRSRLIRALQAAGFSVTRCTYANGILLPVAFAKFRIVEPLLGGEPQSGVQPVAPWLDAALYSALAAEARWIGAGANFPLGQSLIAIALKP